MSMLAGAGFGMLKSELIDRPKAARQRELQATTAALSPWTGLKPKEVKEADWAASALQGAAAGAQMEQGPSAAAPAAGAPAGPEYSAAVPMEGGTQMAGMPMGTGAQQPQNPFAPQASRNPWSREYVG